MEPQYKCFCCHVSVVVTIFCAAELTAILLSYFTNLEQPLMICYSYNVTVMDSLTDAPKLVQHRHCSTSGPLMAWLISHLFTDLIALIGIQVAKCRLLTPFIFTTALDALVSSAYLCVLLFQLLFGDQVDKTLMLFIAIILVLKIYALKCGRLAYWFIKHQQENIYTPRSTIVRENDHFQF